MFGSDFPHAEGMSGVDDYQARTDEFVSRLDTTPDTTQRVMHDNGYRLLGLAS
jgi:predicted TIM-barrel fold metal-dependent hydrolase